MSASYCHNCGKHSYADKKTAATALNRCMARRRNRPNSLRAYRCQFGKGWHLTHQPDDQ